MPTIAEQLTQLASDRDDLVSNLTIKGITGLTGDETFTELVPKVLEIGGGGTNDYIFVEYIENTNDGYINTYYIHNANTKIVTEFYANGNNNNYPFLFGAKNGNANMMAFLVNHQNLGGAFMYQRSNKEAYSSTTYYNQKVTLTIDGANASYTNGINTINLTISGASMDQGVAPLVLFNSNSGTSRKEVVITEQYMLGRIYSFKIYTGNTLKRDFVPAIRKADGAVGMYDNVTKAFFENEGNTEFTAGPAPLPNDYQQVEYIETYTGYQQIDTGIQVHPPQMVKMGIEFKQTGDQPVLGEQGSTRKYLLCSSSGWPRPYWQINYNGNWMASTIEPSAGQYYEYEAFMDNGSQYIKVDGSQIYSDTRTGTISVSTNLVLFNMDNTSWNAKIKLYSCKIYNDGVPVCDLVPCYRKSDNKIGMYDLYSNTFKTNQLTGTFEKGPDV